MITFRSLGVPQPQGSAKAYQRGDRIVVTSDNAKLRPWRHIMGWDARVAMNFAAPFAGPVTVEAVFWLPRPASAPKRRTMPDRKPDVDKLARGLLDALTDGGVIVDDALVVSLTVYKRYSDDANPPGVWAKVSGCS